MKTGVELIAEAMQKQMDVEFKELEFNVEVQNTAVLCSIAAVYAIPPSMRKYHYGNRELPKGWPIGYATYKPSDNRIIELAKAGAIIAAAIDRLQRELKTSSH